MYVCYCSYYYNLGFAATCFEVEKTMHSIGLYRIIFLCATGISALLSLTITVKVNLIILCAMLLMFAPLHLMISCCSNPRPSILILMKYQYTLNNKHKLTLTAQHTLLLKSFFLPLVTCIHPTANTTHTTLPLHHVLSKFFVALSGRWHGL